MINNKLLSKRKAKIGSPYHKNELLLKFAYMLTVRYSLNNMSGFLISRTSVKKENEFVEKALREYTDSPESK